MNTRFRIALANVVGATLLACTPISEPTSDGAAVTAGIGETAGSTHASMGHEGSMSDRNASIPKPAGASGTIATPNGSSGGGARGGVDRAGISEAGSPSESSRKSSDMNRVGVGANCGTEGAVVCDGSLRRLSCEGGVWMLFDCSEHAYCEAASCVCENGFVDMPGVGCVHAGANATCPTDACTPGGKCVPSGTDYSCACDDGYTGTGTKRCERAGPCATARCAPEYPCISEGEAFSCRGQLFDWPITSIAPGAMRRPDYTIDADVVQDNDTGLMWLRRTPTAPAGCSSAPLCTWEEARSYCDKLVFADYDDWRLPSAPEWLSIYDPWNTPSYDSVAFPDLSSVPHWTSTSVGDKPTQAIFDWSRGSTRQDEKSALYGTHCVRLGRLPIGASAARYTIDRGAGTVTDTRTGLVWKEPATAEMTEFEALVACPSGFRLPTVKEAYTLLDYTRSRPPFLDTAIFPSATMAPALWTSMRSNTSTNGLLAVSVDGASTSSYGVGWDGGAARCVR